MSADSGIHVDVSGFNAELAKLKPGEPSVTIGFNTNYAAAVHEILTNKHPQGQAKYLEAALRDGANRNFVGKMIAAETAACRSIDQLGGAIARGVEKAAIQILGNAQELCPVDTGALAASATWQGHDGPGSGKNPAGKTVNKSRATKGSGRSKGKKS